MKSFSDPEICKRLEEVVYRSRLPHKDFAQQIGITKATLSGYLSGKTGLSQKTITNIVRYFNVNANWLLTGKGDMYIGKQASEPSSDYESPNERTFRLQIEAAKAKREYLAYIVEQLRQANASDKTVEKAIMEFIMAGSGLEGKHDLDPPSNTMGMEGRDKAQTG